MSSVLAWLFDSCLLQEEIVGVAFALGLLGGNRWLNDISEVGRKKKKNQTDEPKVTSQNLLC